MDDERDRTDSLPALGLRHPEHDRRAPTRRRREGLRFSWDRRRGERRKQRVRTWLFAAAALATPSQMVKLQPLIGSVSSSVKSAAPLRPDQAYDHLIEEAAGRYDLNPAMIKAIVRTESAFNPGAVSPAGAKGLMQLMPALATDMGVVNVLDPRDNIMGGARYLRQLLDSTGSIKLALASYNAGPGNVARYRGIPPFKETREYVKKITALMALEERAETN